MTIFVGVKSHNLSMTTDLSARKQIRQTGKNLKPYVIEGWFNTEIVHFK